MLDIRPPGLYVSTQVNFHREGENERWIRIEKVCNNDTVYVVLLTPDEAKAVTEDIKALLAAEEQSRSIEASDSHCSNELKKAQEELARLKEAAKSEILAKVLSGSREAGE
jgi:hypothetical protein